MYIRSQREQTCICKHIRFGTGFVSSSLPVFPTRDYGHFLRRGLNTDFHPGLILLNAGVLSRKHFRYIANDCVRRKVSECMPLSTEKKEFLRIVDIRIDNFTIHPNLYKQPPGRSVGTLGGRMERLHSECVFAPAGRTANNVIIVWKRYYVDIFFWGGGGDWVLRVHTYLLRWQGTNFFCIISMLSRG